MLASMLIPRRVYCKIKKAITRGINPRQKVGSSHNREI